MNQRSEFDYDKRLPDGFVINNLDMVHPPMTWQLVWSTGKSHLSARPATLEIMRLAGFEVSDYLKKGLFLISNEGHREWIGDEIELARYDGREFAAYTRHHARHLWLQSVAKEQADA